MPTGPLPPEERVRLRELVASGEPLSADDQALLEQQNQYEVEAQSQDFGERILDPIGLDPFGTAGAEEAARQQRLAQEEASVQVQQAIGQERGRLEEAQAQGRLDIQRGTEQGLASLREGGQQGQQLIGRGMERGAGAVQSGYGQAQGQLARLQAQRGPQAYDAMRGTGQSLAALQGERSRLGQVDARARMDPGMEFRRQQGEESLARRRAATGGRASGRAMKELAEFNQGLASQEYAAAHQRAMAEQQAGFGQQAQIAGVRQQALLNQAGRTDAMGQFGQQRLDQLGMQRAQMGAQQGQTLAGLYGQGYGQQAQMAYGTGANLANMQYGSGQALSGQGQWGSEQSLALTQMSNEDRQRLAGYAGMEQQAGANAQAAQTSGVLGVLSMFSDERLKENIDSADGLVEQILDEIKPYTYEYQNSSHGEGKFIGVMAQDLEKTADGAELVMDLPEGKAINAHKAVSLLLATVAQLHKRIKDLEGRS